MLNSEQTEQIKNQLIRQIEKSFPEDKKEFAKKQIEEMSSEELKKFLEKNQLIKTEKKLEDCVFCSILSEKINSYKIDENKKAIAILEINPLSRGHILIIPKEHLLSADKIPVSVFSLAKKVAKKLKTKLKPKIVEISSSNLFGHEILNIIPSYENEDSSEKRPAKPEELEELQKILIKTKKPAQKPKKIKVDPKKLGRKIWLPKRIP